MNASPDIAAQLLANPVLQPARGLRDSAITAIVLVDGQLDHTTGLFSLREATRPWPLWCTDNTYADLVGAHPVLKVLAHYCGVERQRIELNGPEFRVQGMDELRWFALAAPSKPAPYSPNRQAPFPGDNLALRIRDPLSGGSVLYAPGLGVMNEQIWTQMLASSCVLVDGTFWDDEEMIRMQVSRKRGRQIGHLPQSGPDGMLEHLARLPATTRKILIHVNNTNPILDEDSAQRAELTERGIEVAYDGMEIEL